MLETKMTRIPGLCIDSSRFQGLVFQGLSIMEPVAQLVNPLTVWQIAVETEFMQAHLR